jgi:hypothetical protein
VEGEPKIGLGVNPYRCWGNGGGDDGEGETLWKERSEGTRVMGARGERREGIAVPSRGEHLVMLLGSVKTVGHARQGERAPSEGDRSCPSGGSEEANGE